MTNLELKEQLILRLSSDPRVFNAIHLDNQNNLQAQKNSIKAYEELVSRLCKLLDW